MLIYLFNWKIVFFTVWKSYVQFLGKVKWHLPSKCPTVYICGTNNVGVVGNFPWWDESVLCIRICNTHIHNMYNSRLKLNRMQIPDNITASLSEISMSVYELSLVQELLWCWKVDQVNQFLTHITHFLLIISLTLSLVYLDLQGVDLWRV